MGTPSTGSLERRIGPQRAAALAGAWQAMWWSRLALLGVGVFAISKIGFYPGVVSPPELTPFSHLGNLLAGPESRWDSYWYMHIAATGYGADSANAAFFPLYPALAALVGVATGNLLGGLILSYAALLATLYLLWRLVELELGAEYARPAVMVLAFFPMSLFFSAVYAESLFLATTIGAFYAARTERWALAGVLGALAAATRNTGVLLLLGLAVSYLYGPRGDAAGPPRGAGGAGKFGLRPRYPVRRDLAWLALVPTGLLAFMGWLQIERGDALASLQATGAHWHRHFHLLRGARQAIHSAWDAIAQLADGAGGPPFHIHLATPLRGEFADPTTLAAIQLTDLAFLLYAVVALVLVFKRLPPAYGLYSLPGVVIAASAPVAFEPLASLPRYIAAIFPLQIGLAAWAKDRRATAVVVGVCALALAAFETQFATWRWVA